jgi:quercetin dioxygenase-like cupin family protein
MKHIEWIKDGDELLALVVRDSYKPTRTEFLTPDDFKQQIGFIVYKSGGVIDPHDHKPSQRTIVGTSEVLLVKEGKLEAHIFSKQRIFVDKIILGPGDILLLLAGGHGFKMLEDTTLIEIKQGPYLGLEDKERFSRSLG